ncbi:MAG TPA: enoyl-CoA hydratase [Acidimicrobiales bacterium]|nr:enoyl-CoA hydratase [Acidimicrobiales bacterium]
MDEPAHPAIRVRTDGPVTELTLDRPDKRNALSLEVLRELRAAVEAATGRVIVIGANGPAFSAGHDLGEMVGREPAFYDELFHECAELMEALHRAPQPVIAKVRGVATAAGCQLVAACDLAVVEEGARFATPGVRIGLFCSTPMVPVTRAVGRKRALQLLLTGEMIDARTAADWGLVNLVVPARDLDRAVADLVSKIAEASAPIVATGKAAFYDSIDLAESDAYAHTCRVMAANAADADAQEGIAAFLGKRPPTWTIR